MLREATASEIEKLLLDLGAGNHADNVIVCKRFRQHFLVELSPEDFLGLVFLQSTEVLGICPIGDDRRLAAVTARAVRSINRKLSPNWDLDQIKGNYILA